MTRYDRDNNNSYSYNEHYGVRRTIKRINKVV